MPPERKGPNPLTGAGRPARRPPNDGARGDWLDEKFLDPVQETARLFVVNLKTAIRRKHGDVSVHAAAELLNVDHKSLGRILSGASYPDLPFIVNLETKLECRLWPSRKS
ncbi:hypothetical protein [Leifsonia aquatica]|uniref:hypothetical protein n=1 Tax=Leifsonia aquatica TaxID=144185 RepID=UPI0038204E1B